MSWVQQSAATAAVASNMQQQSASITQAKYQHQQHQHQHQNQNQYQHQHQQRQQLQNTQASIGNVMPAFTGKTALAQNSLPPPPAKSLQNHVQQIPTSQYNALSKVPLLTSLPIQQNFKNSPLQQQLQQQEQLTQQQQQHQHQHQQQSQSRTWQQLQSSQQNNNKIMQSTPTTLNNWPQQQQSPQQPQMNLQQQQSAYQQNVNSWQQPDMKTIGAQNTQQQHYQQQTPNMYENYFTQDQSMLLTQQQQQQNQQQYFQQNDVNTLRQQPMSSQQQQHQQQQYNFSDYDNSNNNNMNTNNKAINNNMNSNQTNDGWGDWGDWNDNNSGHNSDLVQQDGHDQQQQALLNANVIEDSFNTKNFNNNDNWQWKMSENSKANVTAENVPTSIQNIAAENPSSPPTTSNVAATQIPTSSYQEQLHQETSQTLQPIQPTQPQVPIPPVTPQNFQVQPTVQQMTQQQPIQSTKQPIQQQSVDFSVVTSKQATVTSTTKPPNTLPLSTTIATSTSTENKFNVTEALPNSTNFPNNIPNSVYVSQAKPVTRPSRQFASPPTGNTPLEAPDSNLLLPTPPQAFQNDEPPQTQSIMPPPPPLSLSNNMATTVTPNPFKRAGSVKHHRAELLSSTNTATSMMATSFDMPPPPPADFANPSALSLEPDNSEILHENQEVIAPPAPISQNITLPGSTPPNAERNQYMQTSPLSENQDDELNLEADSLPPPGLSRLVLGEPELEATQRLVTGTEEPSLSNTVSSHIDMEERHADGEDTSIDQNPNLVSSTTNVASNRIGAPDISIDRNLYQVPGESNMNNEPRVVTGVETNESITLSVVPSSTQIRSDQREIELDGENLEDQHQSISMTAVSSRNEPPLEGAAATGTALQTSLAGDLSESRHHDKHHHHSHQTKAAPSKSQSNASTGNDSDLEANEPHHNQRFKNSRNMGKNFDNDRRAEKQRREKQRSIDRSLGSEEGSEEYSSERERERERRRGYREGSARSDRANDELRDPKEYQRRREKREDPNDNDRERRRDRYYGERRKEITGGNKGERSQRGTRYNCYDADETEESLPSRHDASTANVSSRKDYARRSMRVHGGARDAYDERSDRDYDDRYDRSHRRPKRERDLDRTERRDDERERRERRGTRRHERGERVDDYDTIERRRRGEKVYPRDYEEYRKQSSRNARDSDLEKEQRHVRNGGGGGGQIQDPRFDPRLMYTGYQLPAGPYGLDYYYYEHLARTNPKAYSEFYKKYYEQQLMATMTTSQQGTLPATVPGDNMSVNATIGGGGSSLAATDGRESVHSGRSSAHNEKERYTQAYMSQANQYHRHYQQKAQLHHSLQQQQLHLQHQQQQQQQQMQKQQQQQQQQQRLSGAIYQNLPLNSTFHGDTSSVASFGSYSRIGRLSAAQSVDNLSTASSQIAALRTMTDYYISKGNMSYTNLDCYADTRSGQISLNKADRSAIEEHRSTPCKFTNFHAVVSLSTGILVTVKPKLTSKGHVGNIVKLQRLGINDAARHLYQIFPGPLVRGLTHKKTIIDFCEEQIRLGPSETTIYARQLTPRSVEKYRGSYTLMWNLLILLLRQNGMVVGTDIAELLLRNQQQFPYQNNLDTASNRHVSSLSDDDDASVESLDGSADSADLKTNNEIQANDDVSNEREVSGIKEEHSDDTNATTSLSEAEITEKFRNYLLYGNVNEALDWATDNNLWGHALFLASKVDRRSHANVMMKFANKLALNDPLQTLYQLMSGRTPSSVTSVQDEKWGDWRPHLSMILSNTSQKPELNRKAITTLGDSLFNRGDLYAAHFCYLMAQVGFGRYQESAVQETTLQQNLPKLVLLGSSHYKNFRDFATNEAIMMTEIYEYACSLNDEKFSLIEFQPYKYLLATRLLDYGFNLKSLMYMEQIAQHIARDPSRYEPSFINKVYEIADRLKYYDPVLEKTLDDQQEHLEENANTDGQNVLPQNFEEQKWLQSLRTIAMQYKSDYPVPTASYPSHDYVQSQQDATYLQNQINQEFTEINKQFNELNLQYTSGNQVEPVFYNPDTMQQQQQQLQQQQITPENTEQQQQDYNQYQATSMASQANYNDYNNIGGAQPIQTAGATDHANIDPYGNYVQQPQQQQAQHQQPNSFYDPNTAQQSYDSYGQGNVNSYGGDYWQQQQQQAGDQNVRPMISMPKSKTYDSDDEQQKVQRAQQKNAAAIQGKKGGNATQQNKNDAKDLNKNSQAANQNSGWFGGIWNKLSLKPKNQMILPDDKNPTIVWDAEKKRWVNTDGDEAAEENLKPPPKMSDVMSQQQQVPLQHQQTHQQPSQPQQHVQYQQNQQQQNQQQQEQLPQHQQMQNLPIIDNNNLQPMTVPLASSSPLSNYSASAAAQGVQNPSSSSTTNAPKPPSLQSNMFKMQRNRTLKNSYVDVFNPSGAPMSKATENVLAPVLPPSTVPQGGFFIPDTSTVGAANTENSSNYQQQQQQQQETPQFYNPNQFTSGGY